MTSKPVYHLDGGTVREVRDWGRACVIRRETVPGHEMPGYFTAKGKWIGARWIDAYDVCQNQDWRKTCRAYARVHGAAVAVYCDDTAIVFDRTDSGRVRESKRHDCIITWSERLAS